MSEQKKFGSSFRAALTWNMLNIGVGQVMTLAIFLLLTTKLSPVVFGIFALALVFIEFFNLEGRFSIIDAIVQRQRFDKKSLATVYWVATGIYGAFAGLFVLLAPVIAGAFGYPEITDVLRALAVTLLIIPFSLAPTSVLYEKHDFKTITLRAIFAKFMGGMTALIVAFGPHPEWALVAQRVMANTAEAGLLIVQTRVFPSFNFDRSWARDFAKEAARIFMAQTCVKSLLRVLDIAIAAFFGAAAVGLWRIAERIMQAVFAAFANPISSLWVILLSAKDTGPEDRKRIFLNLTQLGATILVPVFVGIALISQDFINVFVASEFRAVGPILGLLAIFGSLAPFYNFRNAVLIALKRTRALVNLALWDLVFLSALCLVLRPFGTMGLVSALGLVYLVSTVLFMPIVLKEVGVKLGALAYRVAPAYLGAAVMAATVLISSSMFADMPSLWQIGLKSSIGAATYFAYLFLIHRNWLQKTVEMVLDRKAQVKPA
ncbi:MAG: oligosaccharide flippase family protein [Pseudomonadota bacterium]